MLVENTGKIQLQPEQKVHWVPLGLIFQHSGQFERELADWKTAQPVAKCPLHKLDDLSSVSSTNGGSVLIPVTGGGTGISLQLTGLSAQPHQSGLKETTGQRVPGSHTQG